MHMATVMAANNWKTGICTWIYGIYSIILTTFLIYQLATQIDIFTPFGGLFVAMYTINHCAIKFQIRYQKKRNTIIISILKLRHLLKKSTKYQVTHNHSSFTSLIDKVK